MGNYYKIVILDAVTLKQLYTVHSPVEQFKGWDKVIFSPDSHLLTGYSWLGDCLVSWDRQTGGLVSDIPVQYTSKCNSISYSKCGTMIGCLFSQKIIIYNAYSGDCISSHQIQQSGVGFTWTQGGCLCFATIESRSINICEVSFTSTLPPEKTNSLSTPYNFSTEGFVLLPALSRLAFLYEGRVWVWDAQTNKFLLDSGDIKNLTSISFSVDGHFLVCGTGGLEFYCWEETSDGYQPQKFISGIGKASLIISPNGQSIISFGGTMLQLWPTTNSPTFSPSNPTQAFKNTREFLLEYSPDESLVAFTCRLSTEATVVDARSGNPLLVIDVGTKICGLMLTRDKIVVVGDGMLFTRDLPKGGPVVKVKRNNDYSIQITSLDHFAPIEQIYASISPDLKYIAFGNSMIGELYIYSLQSRNKPVIVESKGHHIGFSVDGSEVWCAISSYRADWWRIVREDESDVIKLEPVTKPGKLPDGFPHQSTHGYKVTSDQWIVNLSGKKLVRLPYYLQGSAVVWNGRFLRVLNTRSQDLVILKLEL